MLIGYPAPWGEPKDPKVMPQFPILLVDDVPLLLVQGYNLGGHPQPVEEHVEYYLKNGRLRRKALVPASRPLAVLDHLPPSVEKFYSTSKWRNPKVDMLPNQLFRLVYSVYRKKGLAITEDGASYSGYHTKNPTWKEARAAVDKLNIRWDSNKSKYTFPDRSTLPSPVRYERMTWEINHFGATATLIIQRQDEEVVNIDLDEEAVNGPPVPQPSLRVFRVKNKKETLATFAKVGMRVPPNVGGGRWQGMDGIKLPIGQAVQAELKLGDKTVLSPVYKP
jgi:hypothetical protein